MSVSRRDAAALTMLDVILADDYNRCLWRCAYQGTGLSGCVTIKNQESYRTALVGMSESLILFSVNLPYLQKISIY